MTYALAFLPVAWEDYLYWQQTEKAVLRRVNALLKEMRRTPFAGTGKPELLRYAAPEHGRVALPTSIGWCTG